MEYLLNALDSIAGSQKEVDYPCSIFGHTVNGCDELNELLRNGFFLLTYRTGFDPLPHSSVTSDKGWGCLVRSSQMLLAHTLWRHAVEDWRLEFFCDIDCVKNAPFSLHNMVREVSIKDGVFRPDYWAPSQGCEAIRCCVNSAVQRHLLSRPVSVVVSSNGSISSKEVCAHLKRKSAVLILAPVRCGAARRMTQTMFFSLENILHTPACVGVVGGVPNRSYYIIGSSNQRLLYLDPHCMTQNALHSCDVKEAGIVTASAELIRSVRWDRIDTSFFFGFFLDTIAGWEKLQARLEEVRKLSIEQLVCVFDGDEPMLSDLELAEWPSE